jgi:hypothetical protein
VPGDSKKPRPSGGQGGYGMNFCRVQSENSIFLKNCSYKEIQSLLLGLSSVILYVIVSCFLMIYETSNLAFQFVYFGSIFIFPFILFVFYNKSFFIKDGLINNFGRSALLINVIFLILLSINLFFGITIESMVIMQVFLGLSYSSLILFKLYDIEYINDLVNRLFYQKWFVYSMMAAILLAFSYSLYAPFVKNDFEFFEGLLVLGSYKVNFKFLLSLSIGAAFIFWVFFFAKVKEINRHKQFTILVCFSPLLLFNINNNFDIEHYNAFLGPAVSVLHGKIPLVDVFCQYGLSYLVFTLGYIFFPNNYSVASVVVSVLNIVCWITFLLIFRRMIKNPLYFSVLAIVFLFGSYYFPLYDNNMIPSTLCMRYFPMIFLSFLLLCKIEGPRDGFDTLKIFRFDIFNALVFLNIVWSIESLISLCVIYGAYLWIMELKWRIFFRKLCILLVSIVSVYLAISAVYLLFFHEVPDYWLYLRYIYDYMNPNSSIGNRFLLGKIYLYRAFFFWVVLAVMHLVVFFYTIVYRFSKEKVDIYIKKLFFLNAVCIVFMVYFALQASILSIMSSGFLSFILLTSILVMEKENTKCFELRLCARIFLFIVSFMFFSIVAKTFFLERKDVYRNGDILYSFVYEGFSVFDRFVYNITHFCSKKESSIGSGSMFAIEENTCKRNNYHDEIYRTIEKWYPDERTVLLFHRDLIEILMEHKKVHKFFSNTVNDEFLKNFDLKIANSLKDKVHEGEIVVVEKNLDILPIEYTVLFEISKLFNFKMMDETQHLRVFKLVKKELVKKSELLFPLKLVGYNASVNMYNDLNIRSPQAEASVLFDKNKWTSWFVARNILDKTDVFSIVMDFGGLFLMDNVKIWRKIDFRKPNDFGSEAFGFLHNFSLSISEDNVHWSMISSQTNFDIGDTYFYEEKFSPHKARYVRLNIFSDDFRYFSISEIEVFGQKLSGE